MKKLIIRNLKLRKSSLILYLILLVISPIYHLFIDKNTMIGGFFYSIIAATIMLISLFDCGNAFRLQFKLGGNKSYYFNHSLPFSAREQTDAHYLTTVIMSLAGALILLCYYDIPASGEINGVNMTTPLFFIAINLIGHAIAFPKCSEIRRDFIPYWGFVVVMNLIMPFVITFVMFGVVRITKPAKMTDSFINNFINGSGILLLILSLAFFSFTYLKQLKRIKKAKQLH